MSNETHPQNEPTDELVARVLARDRVKYLAFIQRRLSDTALCEDILQAAFVRALEKASTLRSVEALDGWLYGILRNAVVDAQRRRASAARALSTLADELADVGATPDDANSPCPCVGPLTEGLKEEYRSAIVSIDVEGAQVKAYADAHGLTANHAGVRVHRARRALRQSVIATCGRCAAAGCQDCTCEKKV